MDENEERTLIIAYFIDGDLQARLLLGSMITAVKSDPRINCRVFFSKKVSKKYVEAAAAIPHSVCAYLPAEYDAILRKLDNPACGPYAMARVFLPHLLKANWCLYMDVDTVVNPNLSFVDRLFTIIDDEERKDTQNRRITFGVLDPATIFRKDDEYCSTDEYVNSGVLLFNLDGMRRMDFTNKALGMFYNPPYKLKFHDQDIISYLSRGRLGYLPFSMNCMLPALSQGAQYFNKAADLSGSDRKDYRLEVGADRCYVYHLSGSAKPYYCMNELAHVIYGRHARNDVNALVSRFDDSPDMLYVSFYAGGDATRIVTSLKSLLKGMYSDMPISVFVTVPRSSGPECKAASSVESGRLNVRFIDGISEEAAFAHDFEEAKSYGFKWFLTVSDSMYLRTDLPIDAVVYAMSPYKESNMAYLSGIRPLKGMELLRPRDRYNAAIGFGRLFKDDGSGKEREKVIGLHPVLWRLYEMDSFKPSASFVLPNNCLARPDGKARAFPFFSDRFDMEPDPVGRFLDKDSQLVKRAPNECFSLRVTR